MQVGGTTQKLNISYGNEAACIFNSIPESLEFIFKFFISCISHLLFSLFFFFSVYTSHRKPNQKPPFIVKLQSKKTSWKEPFYVEYNRKDILKRRSFYQKSMKRTLVFTTHVWLGSWPSRTRSCLHVLCIWVIATRHHGKSSTACPGCCCRGIPVSSSSLPKTQQAGFLWSVDAGICENWL